jgi:hypothetical protein
LNGFVWPATKPDLNSVRPPAIRVFHIKTIIEVLLRKKTHLLIIVTAVLVYGGLAQAAYIVSHAKQDGYVQW